MRALTTGTGTQTALALTTLLAAASGPLAPVPAGRLATGRARGRWQRRHAGGRAA